MSTSLTTRFRLPNRPPPGEWISSTPVCHDPRGCTLRQRNLQSQQRARQLPIKSRGPPCTSVYPVVHAFCRHRIRASLGDYTTVLTAWICSLISFARYENCSTESRKMARYPDELTKPSKLSKASNIGSSSSALRASRAGALLRPGVLRQPQHIHGGTRRTETEHCREARQAVH